MVFDRLFLGKHTLNQVFLGSQLGFLTALFLHFCVRDILFNHIHTISRTPQNFHYVWRRTVDLLILQIVLFGIVSIMMYIVAYSFEMPQDWLKRIV